VRPRARMERTLSARLRDLVSRFPLMWETSIERPW
jgi:hypothetical protein